MTVSLTLQRHHSGTTPDSVLSQAQRNIACEVREPDDIEVFSVLNVEQCIREAGKPPVAQPWNIQFLCIARRAYPRLALNLCCRFFKGIQKGAGNVRRLGDIKTKRLQDVRLRARRLECGLHALFLEAAATLRLSDETLPLSDEK